MKTRSSYNPVQRLCDKAEGVSQHNPGLCAATLGIGRGSGLNSRLAPVLTNVGRKPDATLSGLLSRFNRNPRVAADGNPGLCWVTPAGLPHSL